MSISRDSIKGVHTGTHQSKAKGREPTVHDYRVEVGGIHSVYTVHMQWEWAGASGTWVCEMRENGKHITAPDDMRHLVEPPNRGMGDRMEGRVR